MRPTWHKRNQKRGIYQDWDLSLTVLFFAFGPAAATNHPKTQGRTPRFIALGNHALLAVSTLAWPHNSQLLEDKWVWVQISSWLISRETRTICKYTSVEQVPLFQHFWVAFSRSYLFFFIFSTIFSNTVFPKSMPGNKCEAASSVLQRLNDRKKGAQAPSLSSAPSNDPPLNYIYLFDPFTWILFFWLY